MKSLAFSRQHSLFIGFLPTFPPALMSDERLPPSTKKRDPSHLRRCSPLSILSMTPSKLRTPFVLLLQTASSFLLRMTDPVLSSWSLLSHLISYGSCPNFPAVAEDLSLVIFFT